MLKRPSCCIFLHDITKGMKSYGSIGLLKSNNKAKELFYHCIKLTQKSFRYKNLYALLGFESEKIKKKIESYKFQTVAVYNDQYKDKNYGYAFKLFISTLTEEDLNLINGIVFFPGNILIHKLPRLNYKQSWVVLKKKHKKQNNNDIGCTINNDHVNYMFYDIGEYTWTEILFLTSQDLKNIMENISLYYDNMFMFEIINTIVEKQNIELKTVVLDKIGDVVKISGIKDKNKIKI